MLRRRLHVPSQPESPSVRGSQPPFTPRWPEYSDPLRRLLRVQVVGTAIVLGALTHSWLVFGIALVGWSRLSELPRLGLALGVGYAISTGALTGLIIIRNTRRYDAGIVCGLLVFGACLALNVEHVRRISS